MIWPDLLKVETCESSLMTYKQSFLPAWSLSTVSLTPGEVLHYVTAPTCVQSNIDYLNIDHPNIKLSGTPVGSTGAH